VPILGYFPAVLSEATILDAHEALLEYLQDHKTEAEMNAARVKARKDKQQGEGMEAMDREDEGTPAEHPHEDNEAGGDNLTDEDDLCVHDNPAKMAKSDQRHPPLPSSKRKVRFSIFADPPWRLD
jgi:hypothetical protein